MTVNGSSNSLSYFRTQANQVFTSDMETALRNDLDVNGYVFDNAEYQNTAVVQIYTLTREKRDNIATIEALRKELAELVKIYGNSGTTQYETFNEQIVNLTVRNVEINSERQQLIENLGNIGVTVTITEGDSGEEIVNVEYNTGENESEDFVNKKANFDTSLAGYYASLTVVTETFKSVNISLYESESTVIFNTNNVVASGGINIIIAGVVSLIIGFVIACIVVSIMDLPAYLREKKRRAANAVAGGKEPPEAKEAKDDKPDNE